MEAPKCQLCGKRHWGMCPSELEADSPAKAIPAMCQQSSALTASKPKFDRTAYQREYMRKRRAARKEQGK